MPPRPRTQDRDLPPRVYRHGAGYRFVPVDPVTGRNAKPIALGRDRAAALRRWAELVGDRPPGDERTVAALWKRYQRDELPKKSPATQAGRTQAMRKILAVRRPRRSAAVPVHPSRHPAPAAGVEAKAPANRCPPVPRRSIT